MIYFILFILGLCIGSFLNVLIYRESHEEASKTKKSKSKKNRFKNLNQHLPSWAQGRSYCDHCHKKLSWYDNIPLLSYIALKGKCRSCHKKIPFQYPLVEFLTGLQFTWIYFLLKSNLNFFSRFEGFYSFLTLGIYLLLGACFLAIFMADIKYQIIPDSAVFGGIILGFLKIFSDYRFTGMLDISLFSSALGATLFFLSLVLITKGKGMGIGDIKLAFLMGLILGYPKIIMALLFAFLTGAIVGVILVLTKEKSLKSKIAFGPFMIAGTITALFLADWIIKNLGFSYF
ncbi:hypothetical protein COT75_00615 [Candidatus Beckwithbacteria bacterium CG10_big_fil_rev_8_21_14_0_10_34_10]|uniref:Prepilin peptidase n=1 Tax=Candidatus Beckwithbacteria bacterium CG10_big_fil_rev_8_21_14_0_10_34_10 TaxID=1974495 RepID=A0A2H0WAI7_9BACT|nr:MAG: hypothetical protein COT75_00615 [Candidatus Beckwithbacteria bacterium CG10_big_fil_rev_8_21_14_0_10_34_10]